MFRTKLLYSLLRLVLLVGLLPMPNHISAMHIMRMDETMASSMGASQGNGTMESTDEHSPSSCCDAICPSSFAYAFLTPQYAYVDLAGGSERVLNSSPVVQSIYIETAIPPPKA
jgi:hypothetical protein